MLIVIRTMILESSNRKLYLIRKVSMYRSNGLDSGANALTAKFPGKSSL